LKIDGGSLRRCDSEWPSSDGGVTLLAEIHIMLRAQAIKRLNFLQKTPLNRLVDVVVLISAALQ
jgi:hypothetical protein